MTPPAAFSDPRLLPNFDPDCLPACEGDVPPRGEPANPHDQYMLEFVAAYYALNEAQVALERAQALNDTEAIRGALARLRVASNARDALEDRLAIISFHAQPIMRGGRYVDLLFRLRGEPLRPHVHVSRFAAEITFPVGQ